MGEHRRKADGRRVFSTEFKRTTVQRIVTGEKTPAELSRELDISRRASSATESGSPRPGRRRPSGRARTWSRPATCGRRTPRSGSSSGARSQDHGCRDHAGRAGGCKKSAAVEQRVRAMTTHSMGAICTVLGIARRRDGALTAMNSGRCRSRRPRTARRAMAWPRRLSAPSSATT